MTESSKRLVHFESPGTSSMDFSSASVSDISVAQTSTLHQVNAQLTAHGFTMAPGLNLDGLSTKNLEKVVKCLLDMLGQRMKDMSRTEELSVQLRTLSYDHERMTSFNRTSSQRADNLERELNAQKAREAALRRELQTKEDERKQTATDLKRTLSSMQTLKATHQAELKKREKEYERMADKVSRIADAQAKLTTGRSGLAFANGAVSDGLTFIGKGKGVVEAALEQAEDARKLLAGENVELKGLLVGAVNEAQSMLYDTQKAVDPSDMDAEPSPFTVPDLFPPMSQGIANVALISAVGSLRRYMKKLSRGKLSVNADIDGDSDVAREEDLERMRGMIDDLRSNMETRAPRIRNTTGESGSSEEIDGREQLDDMRRYFEDERDKFNEATAALIQEKLELQEERRKLDEDRQLLQESTTPPDSTSSERRHSVHSPSFKRSSRRAVVVGKAHHKSTSRRSVSAMSPSKSRTEAPFETEVIPKASFASSFLPGTFVLPPPSPLAQIPASTLLPTILAMPPAEEADSGSSSAPIPATPTPIETKKLFPMAKPYVPHMIHAYSPVRPSPLSRLLTVSTTSTGADGPEQPIREGKSDEEMFPQISNTPDSSITPSLTLEEELGIIKSPPRSGSPLRERKVEKNVSTRFVTTRPLKAKGKTGKAAVVGSPKRARAMLRGTGATKVVIEKENGAGKKSSTLTSQSQEEDTTSSAPVPSGISLANARRSVMPSAGGRRGVPAARKIPAAGASRRIS